MTKTPTVSTRARFHFGTKASCLFLASLLAACSQAENPRKSEALGSAAQAVTVIKSIKVELAPGAALGSVALGAADSLRVADRSFVKQGAGWPLLTNAGSTQTELGSDSQTGPFRSLASVSLRERARVNGDLTTGGTVTKQNGVVITGTELSHALLTPATVLERSIAFPDGVSYTREPDQAPLSLAPGAYGAVTIKSRSALSLSPGIYTFASLGLEPQAELRLSTAAGPIIVYVRDTWDFKGSLVHAGDPAQVFVGVLGSAPLSLESPFAGTVVAPNASLRMAPANKVFSGSLFAKQLLVEAETTVNYVPFAHWGAVLGLKPTLQCVRLFREPYASALFGYVNETGSVLSLPTGESNGLATLPAPAAGASAGQPPTTFQPGEMKAAFWAPFQTSGVVSWTLGGTTVTASTSTPVCTSAQDVPRPPQPVSKVREVDRPSPLSPAVLAQIVPAVVTTARSQLPAPVYGQHFSPAPLAPPPSGSSGGVGTIQQGLSNEQAGPADFKVEVTSVSWDDSEFACGSVDPYARIALNGENVAVEGNSRTVKIPRDQKSVHVRIEVWDDDGGFCFGDERLDNDEFIFDVDTYTGEDKCVTGGKGSVCFKATPIASPQICFDWNGRYIDAGPWTGNANEDFLVSKGTMSIPASFARFSLKLENTTGELYSFDGALDATGCVPGPKAPVREHWALGTGLKVTTKLLSQLCLDPAGTSCPQPAAGATPTNFGVVVHPPNPSIPSIDNNLNLSDFKGPISLCSVLAENPASVTDPNCTVRPIDWTTLPPNPVKPAFLDETTVTRTTAVIGHILRRESEAPGKLAVLHAALTRRLEASDGQFDVITDTFCVVQGKQTSCQDPLALILEPDGPVPLGVNRSKYTIAHEFGHFVQGNAHGSMPQDYGSGAGLPGTPPLCRCDHVPLDQQLHCLQSLEEPNAAQVEGYAQYFASRVFNQDIDEGGAGCTFVYYKEFLDTACVPGAVCRAHPTVAGLFINDPPVPLPCAVAKRWRDTSCLGATPSTALLNTQTELDWLQFYYGIANAPVTSERWTSNQLHDAYLVACGGGVPTSARSCGSSLVSWSGAATRPPAAGMNPPPPPTPASLVGGVNGFFGTDSDLARSFRAKGRDFGVDDRTN
jgi:hypothetical protein